jgi:hypothetical protein
MDVLKLIGMILPLVILYGMYMKYQREDFNRKIDQDKLVEYSTIENFEFKHKSGFDYIVVLCKNYEVNKIAFLENIFSGEEEIIVTKNADSEKMKQQIWIPLSPFYIREVDDVNDNPLAKTLEYSIKVQLENKFLQTGNISQQVILNDSTINGDIIVGKRIIIENGTVNAIENVLSHPEIQFYPDIKEDLLEIKEAIITNSNSNSNSKSKISHTIEELNNMTGVASSLYVLVPPLIGWLVKLLN